MKSDRNLWPTGSDVVPTSGGFSSFRTASSCAIGHKQMVNERLYSIEQPLLGPAGSLPCTCLRPMLEFDVLAINLKVRMGQAFKVYTGAASQSLEEP